MPNDSFQVYSFAPSPTSESFYVTNFTPTPLADSFYVVSVSPTMTGACSHSVHAILGVSSDFIAAWNDDTVYTKAKAIIEFGNNRFNDDAVITASSTKTVDRISPFANATFWKASDAFNNKDRQTVNWMVCDQGIKAGDGYRVVDINNTETEKGWWSANKSNGSGVFVSPEWVQTTFTARYVNRVKLFLMEGYSNMSNVTVQYYDTNTASWVAVVTAFTLSPITFDYTWDMEETLVSGLRVYINNTLSVNDYARISELQGLLVLDVSEQIVTCDVESIREEYEGTVPIGTTRSNTFSLELENIDQILSPDNTDESIYAQYMGQDNRVEIYYGIRTSTGPDVYEYVQMGEFWTDEWQVDGGGVTARTSGRDFSKFLQDDRITIGRVWQNETVGTIFKDIMQLMGFGISRIDIDPDATRTFDITYIKDESIWSFMSQLSFADQGLFGFNRDGRFYYHSYNRLNKSPYYNISYDYDQATNIIDGQFTTAIYTNKVTVNVTPVNLENTGRRSIWGAEDPTILSWNTLASTMTDSQTTITLSVAANDPNNLQYYLPEKNGYVYIGTELIRYETRAGTLLSGCVRGHSGTVNATHTAGAYIGEARLWDIEYDNYPALNVQQPYITAIEGRENEGLTPIATLVLFQQDAFTAKLVIANAVAAMTVLEGTGPAIDQPDSELPWTTVIAGQVPVEEAGREKIGINAEDSPENAVAIRKYGKNQIDIDNKWIQDKNHGLELAENIISEFAVPRKIVEFSVFPYPANDVGLRVYVANYDQLSIKSKEYHLIGLRYRFDGGLECTATLRETLASSNHRFVKEYNVDALLEATVVSLEPPITDWYEAHSTEYSFAYGTNTITVTGNSIASFLGANIGFTQDSLLPVNVGTAYAVTPGQTFTLTATIEHTIAGNPQCSAWVYVINAGGGVEQIFVDSEFPNVSTPAALNNSGTFPVNSVWAIPVIGINAATPGSGVFCVITDPEFIVT